MINIICNEIQTVFSPASTAGRLLIVSLFLYLFLFFLEDKASVIFRRALGLYYILIYITIYTATKNGSTMLGHGTTISKILSLIPLLALFVYFIYYKLSKRLKKSL